MQLIEYYKEILTSSVPVFQTRTIAARLNISTAHATNVLKRLSSSGHIIKLRHGLWALTDKVDRLALPYYLTAPEPSYISLQTALYYHEIISQIPDIIYAVSIARTTHFQTPLGSISIHHVQPDFFFGYNLIKDNVFMATPEKALIDIFYLTPAKTTLFKSLPEVTLPDQFDINLAREIIGKIPYAKRRSTATNRLNRLLNA